MKAKSTRVSDGREPSLRRLPPNEHHREPSDRLPESHVKMSGVNANILVALDALLREKSVTRAAGRLGVGQPALSHALSRLRAHFRDDLLVLNGRNYVLTDKAEKLAGLVANATRALADVFEEPPSFDAATSSNRFVVACSDCSACSSSPRSCAC